MKRQKHATVAWARRFALVHGAQALGALADGKYRDAEAALSLAAKYAAGAAEIKEQRRATRPIGTPPKDGA